jgi:uncharacterized membrane protein YbaN (DUF454 family)
VSEPTQKRLHATEPEALKPQRAGVYGRLLDLLGFAFFAVGVVGIFVPLLPTTIFWIVAALLWMRSAPHRTGRILAHPRFGPPIKAFLEEGALSGRSKSYAVGGMSGALLIVAWTSGLESLPFRILAAVLVLATLWVVTRPRPSR